MKKVILYLFLLITDNNAFTQLNSIIEYKFDNATDTTIFLSIFNQQSYPWDCIRTSAKYSLNFEQNLQPMGSKGFFDFSWKFSSCFIEDSLAMVKFDIDTFSPQKVYPANWSYFGKDTYINFWAKTGGVDTMIFYLMWYDNKSWWMPERNKEVAISTNNNWSQFNIKLTDLLNYVGLDFNKSPYYIALCFGAKHARKSINFSLDNIGVTNDSYKDTLIINAGADKSIVCGEQTQLSVICNYPDTAKLAYSWMPTDCLSASNIPNPVAEPATNKTYIVTVSSTDGRIARDSVKVTVNPLKAIVKQENVFCGVASQLNVTTNLTNGNNLIYKWNPTTGLNVSNIKNPLVTIISPTKYVVEVSTQSGCIAKDSIVVSLSQNNFSEAICLVTVDAISGKNEIVWSKTPGKHIKEYKVKKESTIAGQYVILDTILNTESSVFIDNSSEPSKHADRYILTTIDSCDNESVPSNVHQTIHLAINQGLPGTYNLIWTPYIGFNYNTYYIYKGSTPGNLKLIDSLASTYIQYTDSADGVAYYQIAVRKSSPCFTSNRKSGNEPISQSVSNLDDNLKFVKLNSAIMDIPFTVHPNPFIDELVIESYISKPAILKIELYNVLGMKIYEYSSNKLISGNYKKVIQINDIKKVTEINILKVAIGDKTYYIKTVKK